MLSKKNIIKKGEVSKEDLYYFFKNEIESRLLSIDSSLMSLVLGIDSLRVEPQKYLEFLENITIPQRDYEQEMADGIGTDDNEAITIRIPLNGALDDNKELLNLLENKGFNLVQALKTLEDIFKKDSFLEGTKFSSFSLCLSVDYKVENIQPYTRFYLQFNFRVNYA